MPTKTIPLPTEQPTMAIWPDVGPLFDMGKSATYDAAAAGTFPVPVIRCGRKLRVATAEVRRVLGLDA